MKFSLGLFAIVLCIVLDLNCCMRYPVSFDMQDQLFVLFGGSL